MKFSAGPIGLLLFATLLAASAAAETRYVSDQLIITLRSGKGNEYKIIKSLQTDTPVEVLEEDSTYARVRAPGGEEGYVLKQYLTISTPKPVIIARLEKEQTRLKKQLAELEKKRNELAQELETARQGYADTASGLRQHTAGLENQLAETEQELETVNRQYEDLRKRSENVMQLSNERDSLEAENSRILAEVQQLRAENESLLRTGMIQWFLAGGGVFFIGWISGKLSRKKKRSGF